MAPCTVRKRHENTRALSGFAKEAAFVTDGNALYHWRRAAL